MSRLGQSLSRIRFSLSTRIILGMAGVVLLTALASVIIFNFIITNQTRDLEGRLQKAFVQAKATQAQIPPQTSVDQLKSILNDQNLTPEQQLDKARGYMRSTEVSNNVIIGSILRDSGFPVTHPVPRYRPPDQSISYGSSNGTGDTSSSQSQQINIRPKIAVNGATFEQQTDDFLFSPVVQASLLGSLVAAICAVLIGWFLSRTVIKPLRALEHASERIADGNYNLEIKPEGKDDLGRLARSFNKMSRALRQTERKRKDLVADVAHELRTPLSSIQGYTEVLRDGLVTEKERQSEIYEHILKEVRHLTGMVNSMRVWMNNEQALEYLNLEDLPAQTPAQMVIDRFQPQAAEKEVKLDLKVNPLRPDLKVKADNDALNHVLSNLVDNALRYTPAGGSITVSINGPVAVPGEKGKVVWFEVADTGSGIPKEHLPFVFERFYRVDKSRNRSTGGTGLGLAIVHDTVQALGGEVQIESEVDKGTKVRFSLPAVEPPKTRRKTVPTLAGAKSA